MQQKNNTVLKFNKNSDKLFSSFTKKYPLSKTLRFELKPVSETKKFLDKFVKSDKKRDKDYKELKEIIDEYHKYFIDVSLKKENILDVEDLTELKEILGSKNKSREIQDLQKKLGKQITSCFEDKKDLFDQKLITDILPNWLNDQNTENADDKKKIVKEFSKFTTYLTNFNENRKNMYSDKDQPVAISYRIVNENFPKFVRNIKIYEGILKNHPELHNNLKEVQNDLKEEFEYFDLTKIENMFDIQFFNKCLNQSGIDHYNTIIGGKSLEGGQKIQGINEMINLYRQQKGIKNKNLPDLQALYKQILSDRGSHSFIPENFLKNRELIDAINNFWNIVGVGEDSIKEKSLLSRLENFLKNFTSEQYDLSKIYYSQITLNNLSHSLFEGDYGYIRSALEDYSDKFNTKKEKKKFLESDFSSLKDIQEVLKIHSESFEGSNQKDKEARNFKTKNSGNNNQKKKEKSEKPVNDFFEKLFLKIFLLKSDACNKEKEFFSHIKESFKTFSDSVQDCKKQDTFTNTQIENIKTFLEEVKNLLRLIKPFYLKKEGNRISDLPVDSAFYSEFDVLYEGLLPINKLYDKCRNYITSNKKHLSKFKINFENSTLLGGWDLNKESDYLSVILRKKNKLNQWNYYLGVMNKKSKKLFDYHITPDDSQRIQQRKDKLLKEITQKRDEDHYEKMIYKLLPGPHKMLPKVFFSQKREHFNPSEEVKKIKNKKTYVKNDGENFNLKDCHKLIDFYKESINKHPDWKKFDFQFSDTSLYTDISNFFEEVRSQGYKLSFDKIKKSYIDQKIKNGELYLFKIYNKDFSEHSKGSPGLHTSYFRLLFEEENLKNIVYKLNGQAEIFYREKSKDRKITHPKNKAIKNKNPLNPKKESTFKYDLIKDKRFTEDKFFLHIPVTLNFKSREMKNFEFNQNVLKFLKNDDRVNIIGIDRGERHLAYYTVINQSGKILKQKSFNEIKTSYKNKNNQDTQVKVNFHRLLTDKEKTRDQERKEWREIENIKELKSGYISHLVHQISKLIIKYNAIVVFEDLNFGFKKGRMKFEKQIYQKFEKALLDKLNYLVFKDTTDKQWTSPGGYLNAYQLTAPFESFQKMGKQTGFLFYVPAYHTSKVCPLTGFVPIILRHLRYKNLEKSRCFFKRFENIYFNKEENYFVFKYQDNKIMSESKSESQYIWEVCTHGQDRFIWNRKSKKHEKINITHKIKELFDKNKIEYADGRSVWKDIYSQEDPGFFKDIMKYLKITLQLRYCDTETTEDQNKDFILSPVKDKYGKFFDSRKVTDNDLPKNSDANGAYHIALKGLLMLQKLNNSKDNKLPVLKDKDWFDFIQNKESHLYKKSG